MNRYFVVWLWFSHLFIDGALAQISGSKFSSEVEKAAFHIIPIDIDTMGTPLSLTRNSETGEFFGPFVGTFKFEGTGYAELSLALKAELTKKGLYTDSKVLVWSICSCTGSPPTECVDFHGEVYVENHSLKLYEKAEMNTLERFLKVIRPRKTANLEQVEIERKNETIIVDMTTPEGKATQLLCHDIVTVPKKKDSAE